ncbi:MAG: hypothetical protein LBH48_07355 [Bifidobacteriaceae bacterium]|nr:hypothetical protein [Bifidobacteriaceae bacterium]
MGLTALVGAGIVGGCSEGEERDVATVEDLAVTQSPEVSNALPDGAGQVSQQGDEAGAAATPAGDPTGPGDQRLTAEALYSCLVDAGLPAQIQPVNRGGGDGGSGDAEAGSAEAFVTFGSHAVMQAVPGKPPAISLGEGSAVALSEQAQQAFFDAHRDPETFGLQIDGVDYSVDFERCYTESGYFEPVRITDEERVRQNKLMAEATNKWTACARENGYPNLPDVLLASNDPDYYPSVELPPSITESALRSLLEACPNFDEEAAAQVHEAMASGEDIPYPLMPNITIPMPDEDPSSDSPAMQQWNQLTEILYEQEQTFFTTNPPPT